MIPRKRNPIISQWGPPITLTSARGPKRRGVAMMLVLFSLATATILASAYLASRDNSAQIGTNVAAATEARAAATSGSEFATAIVQTESDWRTAVSDGSLVSNLAIGNAVVDIDVADATTGALPADDTTSLLVTTNATVANVTQTSESIVDVPRADEETHVDLDFGEFSVFAGESLLVDGTGTVGRWMKSPHAVDALTESPIKIGTILSNARTIEIDQDAAIVNGVVFSNPFANDTMVRNDGDYPIEVLPLGSPLPFPLAPETGEASPDGTDHGTYDVPTGLAIVADQRFENLSIGPGSVLDLRNDATLVIEDDLTIPANAQVLVQGHSKLIVHGTMTMGPGSSLTVLPTMSVRIWVGDGLQMNDAYMGAFPDTGDEDRAIDGTAPWSDPDMIHIYSAGRNIFIPPAGSEVLLDNGSVIKGRLHVPTINEVTLRTGSAIYGNAVTRDMKIHDDSALFHDPGLDGGLGFTNPESEIWGDDGQIPFGMYFALSSITDTAIDAAESVLGLDVVPPAEVFTPSAEGVATPRPKRARHKSKSSGSDVRKWERRSRRRN